MPTGFVRYGVPLLLVCLVLGATAALAVSATVYQLKTALSSDEMLEQLRSDARFYFSFGTFLSRQGELGKATAVLAKAVELDEEYPEAHYNLGVTLYQQGDRDAAREQFAQAAELYPGYAKAWNALGILALEEKRFAEAIPFMEKTVELSPGDKHARFDLGLAYAGEFREVGDAAYARLALAQFEEALTLDPSFEQARANSDVMKRFMGEP